MVATPAQREWVARVLGVGGAPAHAGAPPKLMPVWTGAKDAVDASIARLCDAVREVDHPLTGVLVDRGLSGFTGRLATPLVAALLEHDARPGPAQAAAVRDRVEAMRAFIARDPVIARIEDNPFGVAVAIRAPFLSALSSIAGLIPA